jgi:hypothetical protein
MSSNRVAEAEPSTRVSFDQTWRPAAAVTRLLPYELVVFTIAALFLRRPDQFLHPYIWVEDGFYILHSYLDQDIGILFRQMSGYLVFASEIISYLSFKTALLWTPQIELTLVVILTSLIVLAIAFSPTHLQYRPLCAIATLLIPVNPEVYAVGWYGFWWAGLLLLLVPVWTAGSRQYLRWFYIVFGGLSSPLIVPVTMALGLRLVVERSRSELIATLLALAVCAAQIFTLITSNGLVNTPPMSLAMIRLAVDKFAGFFFLGQFTYSNDLLPGFGFVVLAVLAVAAFASKAARDRYFLLLAFLYAAICGSVALRGPVADFHPIVAGPRYFFYPYILLTWIGIWIAARSNWGVRSALAAAFLFAFVSAARQMSERHVPIDWRANMEACARSTSYKLPVHWDGSAEGIHYADFTGDECKRLMSSSLF